MVCEWLARRSESRPLQALMTPRSLLESPWLEPALLVAASRRAEQLSDEARARMKPWVVAAQARFRVARELRDSDTQSVALGLLKEAAFFALCALQAADPAHETAARSPKEAWLSCPALADMAPGAPEQLALVRAAFSTDEALSIDRMAPRQANELRLAAEASVAWLLMLAEIRTPAELSHARLVRLALAVVGVVLTGWVLVAYWLSLTAIEAH
jgi:hypothetical protein